MHSRQISGPWMTVANAASPPASLQRKSTERHEDKSEPCAAAARAQISAQQRTVDPTDEKRRQGADARISSQFLRLDEFRAAGCMIVCASAILILSEL